MSHNKKVKKKMNKHEKLAYKRANPRQLYTYEIKVSADQVYDGDTLKKVMIDLGFKTFAKQDLRMARIQAPEIRTRDLKEKEKGLASRDYLRSLIADKENVVCNVISMGKYGRYITEIYVNGKNVNNLMIKSGHAKVYE